MKVDKYGWYQDPKTPKSIGTNAGWFGELDKVYVNQILGLVVMTMTIETEWGNVIHACVRNRNNSDIPWAKKQDIKNKLFGAESQAIEVFPKESELVDEAGMYHIWILEDDFKIPFTIKGKESYL
jgi:hypothetical protein